MKIKPNYKLRDIAGETIVVNQGTTNVDMTRIISLNESVRLLYETWCGREFNSADIARTLVEAYGIDIKQAECDAWKWIESLTKCGIIVP